MKQGELDLINASVTTKCKCGAEIPEACGYICSCGRVYVNGNQTGWSYGDSAEYLEQEALSGQ